MLSCRSAINIYAKACTPPGNMLNYLISTILQPLYYDLMKKNRLTLYIIISMILGILVGYLVHVGSSPEFIKAFSKNVNLLGKVFIRLVQMIIAPLVFSTLVVGIAKLGDLKAVGRVGGKAMLWFITASLVSLTVGLVLVNTFQPGDAIDLSQADTEGVKDLLAKNQ